MYNNNVVSTRITGNKKDTNAHSCSLPVIQFYYFFITRGNDTRNEHESTSACFK